MYRHPRSAYARQYGLNAQLPSKPATNSAKRSQTLDAIIWRLCRNNYGAATPRNQATANLFAARSPIVPVSRIIFAGTRANGRRLQLKVQRREIPSPLLSNSAERSRIYLPLSGRLIFAAGIDLYPSAKASSPPWKTKEGNDDELPRR